MNMKILYSALNLARKMVLSFAVTSTPDAMRDRTQDRRAGHTSLTLFGDESAPHFRRLSTQFTAIDAFHVDAEASAHGGNRVTTANVLASTLYRTAGNLEVSARRTTVGYFSTPRGRGVGPVVPEPVHPSSGCRL